MYDYTVDKFWVVRNVLADGRLELITRRRKTHVISQNDPNLRRARWWERWFFRSRFRAVEQEAKAFFTSM